MLDDSNMENKNIRPVATLGTEVKINKFEGAYNFNKTNVRNGRKREGNVGTWGSGVGNNPSCGAAVASCSEQRPAFQKQLKADKRQKSRSGNGSLGTSRKNGYQVVDSTDPDIEFVLPENGRKQNLAHLLNMKFQLVPRGNMASPYWKATHPDGRRGGRHHLHTLSLHRAHYNKDHFLQANCQFIVKADKDYSVYMADPDLLVQWELIEQIRLWGSEVPSCPICLHPPVAARITRCGHVFCWPCILHFLALSDKPSRPCPICDQLIRSEDLKSVIALAQKQLKVGDVVEMRLMKRDRHSLQPQPVHRETDYVVTQPVNQQPNYLTKAGEQQMYSKLLLATPKDVVDIILQRERIELETQWAEEKDCPESCFIHQALELVAARESSTILDVSESLRTLSVEDIDAADENLEGATAITNSIDGQSTTESEEYNRSRYTSTSSEGLIESRTITEDVDGHGLSHSSIEDCSTMTMGRRSQQQKNVFYFYQSNDGQSIYLHSLNVQMLVRQYGSLESCPEIIQGRILERDTLSMNEELRNRLRYLGHLPLSMQFEIAEISLEHPLITDSVLEEFKDRLSEREERRRRKVREERKRDREIQRAEEAKWRRNKKEPNIRLDSEVHFPGFSSASVQRDPALPSQNENVANSTPSTLPPVTVLSSTTDSLESAGPSFAQMLRQGKSKPSAWPTKKGTVTQATVPMVVTSPGRTRHDSDNEPIPEDYVPPPEYRDTFSSALAAAFDKAAKSMDTTATKNAGNEATSKKKGKKTKQKVLFATGMNFM